MKEEQNDEIEKLTLEEKVKSLEFTIQELKSKIDSLRDDVMWLEARIGCLEH